jgi:hypothetical protein
MTLLLALAGLSSPAHAFEHTISARFRYGFVPKSFLDIWYFNEDDPGALAEYPRPTPSTLMYGLDYTLAVNEGGGPSVQFWAERLDIAMEDGYWDDKESVPDHLDGDWLAPRANWGAIALGVNYVQEVPFNTTSEPVYVALNLGGGAGIGFATSGVDVWHAQTADDVVDPNCPTNDTDALAPERAPVCVKDGELDQPDVLPIIDIVIGPEAHFGDYVSVRFDFGVHLVSLYAGIAAGGVF